MATTNKQKRTKTGTREEEKAMTVGVLEKIGILRKSKVKTDPAGNLVARCKEGDPAAFRDLYDKHVAGVHRHLTLLMGPGEDVDDLVQLVFLNVFQSIKRFRGSSAFSTWLFRITINVARQEIRLRTRHRRLDGAVREAATVVGQVNTRNAENRLSNWQQVYDILDRLPNKKRETFILYMYEGYSLEEIADLLGSSVSTIGSRLQSGRKEIINILVCERKR